MALRGLTKHGLAATKRWLQNQLPRATIGVRSCSGAAGEIRKEPGEMDNLMDIGSRRIFDSEHDMFRETVRKYNRDVMAPRIPSVIKEGHIGREEWLRAGEYGFLNLNIPEELGGMGGSYLHSVILHEEQMYTNNWHSGFSMHTDIVAPYITSYGTPEQIQKYIPRMTAGEVIGSLAMTEPGAGSDLQGITTTAVKDGDDWVLNGSKCFITNGWLSDLTIVVAKTNKDAKTPAKGLSLFLVDADTPGFTKGPMLNKLGMKGNDTCDLFFDDVRLPADALLGKENQAFYYLMKQLPAERLIVAVVSMASMEWMFETAREYVKDRKAFGKRIADLQVIQHKLAEIKTTVCVGRSFVDSCIEMHDMKRLDAETASMAKYWTSEELNKMGYDCTQMFGGSGFMADTPITVAYASARVQTIYAGTTEIMKELIARSIVHK